MVFLQVKQHEPEYESRTHNQGQFETDLYIYLFLLGTERNGGEYLKLLKRCLCQDVHPNEDATSQKKQYKLQIVGGGSIIERLLPVHPSKPNHFETASNATLQAPMHIMRHSLPDIVLPWQKSSFQNRPFTHKLQFSFKARHCFFQERVSLQNIISSPPNMQRSSL